MAYESAICQRCKGERWPDPGHAEPYTCQRCRAVLAGRNAVDPVGSPAQQAAKAAGAERLKRNRAGGLGNP